MTGFSLPFGDEPCSWAIGAGSMIGVPCPSCGHTDLVHPGVHNPAIDACLLCKLEIAIARLAPPSGALIKRVHIHVEREEGEGPP